MKDKRAVTTPNHLGPLSARLARSDEVLEARARRESIVRAQLATHTSSSRGISRAIASPIVLRDLAADAMPRVVIAALEEAGQRGVPNAFGPQRFGRDGDNPERALAWLSRTFEPGPKDRRERRLLFSALQSELFNRVLGPPRARRHLGSPARGRSVEESVTPAGIFLCEDPVVDGERARRGEIRPTGPIFGVKMRWPEGRPAEIEREILVNGSGQKIRSTNTERSGRVRGALWCSSWAISR